MNIKQLLTVALFNYIIIFKYGIVMNCRANVCYIEQFLVCTY